MAFIPTHRTPRMIELGADQTVTFDVVDSADTDTSLSPSAGTYELWDGDEELVAATAVSDLGPPASYDLVAADTSGRSPSSTLQEIWKLTLSGRVEIFFRTAYLVRYVFRSTVTDSDLTSHDSTLAQTVPAGTTFDTERTLAREKIVRDLIKKGRRPELILDPWALHDAELALTLHFIYRSQKMSLSDGRYEKEAKVRLQEYKDEMDSVTFRYDSDRSGKVSSATQESGSTLVLLTGATRNFKAHGAGVYRSIRRRR